MKVACGWTLLETNIPELRLHAGCKYGVFCAANMHFADVKEEPNLMRRSNQRQKANRTGWTGTLLLTYV